MNLNSLSVVGKIEKRNRKGKKETKTQPRPSPAANQSGPNLLSPLFSRSPALRLRPAFPSPRAPAKCPSRVAHSARVQPTRPQPKPPLRWPSPVRPRSTRASPGPAHREPHSALTPPLTSGTYWSSPTSCFPRAHRPRRHPVIFAGINARARPPKITARPIFGPSGTPCILSPHPSRPKP